jgi:hypothetical protein
MANLTLRVLAARNLIAADSNGYSDPYVNLRIESNPKETKRRTRVVKKSLNPEWKESFTVPFASLADALILHVWDHDHLKNDPLGVATLPLEQCQVGSTTNMWLKLDGVDSGELNVEVEIPPGKYTHEPVKVDSKHLVLIGREKPLFEPLFPIRLQITDVLHHSREVLFVQRKRLSDLQRTRREDLRHSRKSTFHSCQNVCLAG